MLRTLLTASLLVASLTLHAQQDVNRDGRVHALVPIADVSDSDVPVAGAYGSLWSTQLWLHNASAQDIGIIQEGMFCQIPIPCDTYRSGQTVRAWAQAAGAGHGALLSFTPDVAPQITISSRLLEHSRRAQPNGIEIPVVWEEEFLTAATRLLAIPSRPDGRVALRVYAPTAENQASTVRVEAIALSGDLLGTSTLVLTRTNDPEPFEPGFAFIPDVVALFPAIAGVERFDLRITPLQGQVFYAFASETDRDTQHVLLITPDTSH